MGTVGCAGQASAYGEILYMEIDDYYAFEYLAPHLEKLDISLNELNDLAAQLAALDEVQGIAFEGMFSMEVQKKVNANGGIITMQDMRDLAVSARADCYHVVDAADDAALGRFYAENDFIPELDGVSDTVFKMLDFAGIGRMMRQGENGVFVGSLYVLCVGELTAAPPCPKELPPKPSHLFRLTLGLHPDFKDARTATLNLPATEAELSAAQEQLGTLEWENAVVLDYDGVIPNAANFADLPMEMNAFNSFSGAVRDIPFPDRQIPKLKALLEQFEVKDIGTAMQLVEHLEDYNLTPKLTAGDCHRPASFHDGRTFGGTVAPSCKPLCLRLRHHQGGQRSSLALRPTAPRRLSAHAGADPAIP